jgi:universal stress protein E
MHDDNGYAKAENRAMIENILLLLPTGRDFDAPSIRRASSIASQCHARTKLLSVVYEPLLEGYMGNTEIYAPLRRRLIEESREWIDSLAVRLRSEGLRCEGDAVWSPDRHELVAQAAVLDHVDLVVMEPSDRAHGLSHADWKLISSCPAPILVVRGDGRQPYGHVVAGVDPYHEHAKPAELDTAILQNAKAFAELTNAELKVVHCFATLGQLTASDYIELPAARAEVALERARQEALDALLAKAGISKEIATLLSGRPETVLASMAENGEADLFVLGAASRGRIKEFFVGSTAERVLHRTETDVLIVKPPGFQSSVSLGPETST